MAAPATSSNATTGNEPLAALLESAVTAAYMAPRTAQATIAHTLRLFMGINPRRQACPSLIVSRIPLKKGSKGVRGASRTRKKQARELGGPLCASPDRASPSGLDW